MEGIQYLSDSAFVSSTLFTEDLTSKHRRFDTFEIGASSGATTVSPSATVAEAHLAQWATSTSKSGDDGDLPRTMLRLVSIERDLAMEHVDARISKEAFYALFRAIRAHPASLYLVSCYYDGFHSFPGAAGSGSLPTWFVGTAAQSLLWTFDADSLQTVGILMQRRSNVFGELCELLRVYSGYAHIPYILHMTVCLHQQRLYDIETAADLDTIRFIEHRTGFGPIVSGRIAGSPDSHTTLEELTSWSQSVGEVGERIINKKRHQQTTFRILESIKATRLGSNAVPVHGRDKDRYDSALGLLTDALPILERQMTVYGDYISYMQHRTERLSSVLFVLLTHKDARATITLAAAARRDSSSMKTVAIMTMAFLPGTFFAALFALPSLQWGQQKVIQDGFWVYWAFTLPLTAVVFGIWLCITERHAIAGVLRGGEGGEVDK